ncbi:MAG: hypothetical protein KGJ78_18425 [Alphaproteobacteria bacterium]|nr:hypothetical protein [Alphaproteobacteria bacterium]
MLPRRKALTDFQDLDGGPTGLEQRLAPGGDSAVLKRPEQVQIREQAFLAEQVLMVA